MSKKIVILNGSPRKNGNTAALIDAFARGAEASGHAVARFDLQGMNIHPCVGCLRGGKTPGGPCAQKDDMDRIYPAYREADVLVLASPMYYWSVTAQLKAALDRLFAVMEADGATPKLGCVLLMPAEEDTEANFAPVAAYYENLLLRLDWQDMGRVFVGGVYQVGDIEGKPGLKEAEKLGAAIG